MPVPNRNQRRQRQSVMTPKIRAGEIAFAPPKTPIADAIFDDTGKGLATPVRRNKSTLIELLAKLIKKTCTQKLILVRQWGVRFGNGPTVRPSPWRCDLHRH